MDLAFNDEVRAAQVGGAAVVALESSLIAHGFPPPDNLALGQRLEALVRDEGAVPATIAVIAGRICVGLSQDQMSHLASEEVEKCSARDLPFLCAMGRDGATTVAATALIAAAAAIPVFATGGIGGVHRDARQSFDISADLVELGRTRIAVVCADAKSLLDVAATSEMLETQGVPLVGYRCREMPAFFSAESGIPLDHHVDEVTDLAAVVSRHLDLDGGGLVVCNPPPGEVRLPRVEVDALVERALGEAADEGISGAQLTPFVLGVLDRLSGGRTRACNMALLEANARLAARLAIARGVS